MDVSVIMINYNTFALTKDAVESIFAQTKDVAYEIILIDNASPDGSGEKLKNFFGNKITYLQAGGNLGTSKAFNLGLKSASGKYILWLNTDILLKENFIGKLFCYMEAAPDCGICGGNVLDFEGKPMHSFRRRLPSPKTDKADMSIVVRIWRKLFKKRLSNEYNYTGKPLRVGYITGADMMVRREIFEKVGGFDEDIFMYSEETEFTFRMKQATDYTAMSVPDAHIYHLEGASFSGGKKGFNERRFRIILTGDSVYMTKSYGAEQAKKFLRRRNRAYRKMIIFSALLFKKEKCREFRAKRRIVTEFLNCYPEYMEREM